MNVVSRSTRSTVTLPTELQVRTEKVGDDLDGKSRCNGFRVNSLFQHLCS